MTGSKKKYKNVLIILLIIAAAGLALFLAFSRLSRRDGGNEEDNSGIPDVVSSRTYNDECHLLVVANSQSIEDRQIFAEKVIDMYRKNEFFTTKFSRDLRDTPGTLYIKVYLHRSDVEKGREVFDFTYDENTENISF